jgi:hypothetical protein
MAPPPKSIIPQIELPARARQALDLKNDIRNQARFHADIDPTPGGNYLSKVHLLREERRKAREEGGFLYDLWHLGRNTITELRELPIAIGAGLATMGGIGVKAATDKLKAEGMDLGFFGGTMVSIPDPETGEPTPWFTPFRNVEEMPEELKDRLVRLGASFPHEPSMEGWWDLFVEAEARRFGFVEPGEVPEDATVFGVPLFETNKKWVPHLAYEETIDRPITRVLDVAILASLPSAGVRGASGAARLAGRGKEAAALARTAEKLHPGSAVRLATRKGIELTPPGRFLLEQWDSRVFAKELVNESGALSRVQQRASEINISRSLHKLSDEELKLIQPVAEGRGLIKGEAILGEGKVSVQLEDALNVVKAEVRAREAELAEVGLLGRDTAEARILAPAVVSKTGKRIPNKHWGPEEVHDANQKITRNNLDLQDNKPLYMTPKEYDEALGEVAMEFEGMRELATRIPEVEKAAPFYFPRFPEEATAAQILKEFIKPSVRKAPKQPFQKQFSGTSVLRYADAKDVRKQLLRYNAQVRRAVDTEKLIQEIKSSPFTKPLKIDKKTGELLEPMLPGHRVFAPEGFLQFYRKQTDLVDWAVKALDDAGDFESALAVGILEAMPELTKVSSLAVKRRINLHQIPTAMARTLEAAYRPPNPLIRAVYDKPLEAWRTAVLAFSPRWYVNNIVGGSVLGTAAGIPPWKLYKPLTSAEKAAIPEGMIEQSRAFYSRFAPKLEGPPSNALEAVEQTVRNFKPIKMPMDVTATARDLGFEFNSLVDNHFRSRVWLQIGRKEARNQLMKETGRTFFSSREELQRLGQIATDSAQRRALTKRLDRLFVNFNNLTPTERRFFRRVVPFWSWYREITRVSLNMPLESPFRASALRVLSDLGNTADDLEMRRHTGFSKRDLREWLDDRVFVGLDHEGSITFASPRGLNVFYGVGMMPPPTDLFSPPLQIALQEMVGGRNFGRWGSFVPFRRFSSAELRERRGVEAARTSFKEFGLRGFRTLPQFTLLEDLIQYQTEGRVTQRFEDVTPLSNVPRVLRGEAPISTAVPAASKELEPKRERELRHVVSSFFGVPMARFELEEIIEQELKDRRSAVDDLIKNMMVADPKFRERMKELMDANRGIQPRGIRDLNPQGRWFPKPLPRPRDVEGTP